MILTETKHATLSKHLKINNNVQIKNTEINFDPEFWELILVRLENFIVE
jgi:hypothetical protein